MQFNLAIASDEQSGECATTITVGVAAAKADRVSLIARVLSGNVGRGH